MGSRRKPLEGQPRLVPFEQIGPYQPNPYRPTDKVAMKMRVLGRTYLRADIVTDTGFVECYNGLYARYDTSNTYYDHVGSEERHIAKWKNLRHRYKVLEGLRYGKAILVCSEYRTVEVVPLALRYDEHFQPFLLYVFRPSGISMGSVSWRGEEISVDLVKDVTLLGEPSAYFEGLWSEEENLWLESPIEMLAFQKYTE